MKIAFYYHVPFSLKNNEIYLPGYFGVFIESLANEIETLYLVMHEANNTEAVEADYKIKSKNIVLINLGFKTKAWHRSIFHSKILKSELKKIDLCDVFLVRSPSPLAPYFSKYVKQSKLVYMIVGDYGESVVQFKPSNFREYLMIKYIRQNDFKFKKTIKKFDILVNSPALYENLKSNCKSISLIKTTTLTNNDFFYRDDTCQNQLINILYTGRFDRTKGVFELIEGASNLLKIGYNICLNFVGWDLDKGKANEIKMIELVRNLEIDNHVKFHGMKKIGADLNEMYKMSDLYVLPSYEEGFPRTIWEALANSLPVIATNVGGIPKYLTNSENVLLIEPKSVIEIENAIIKLINDSELRKNLIKNGINISKKNTLEVQSNNLIKILENLK